MQLKRFTLLFNVVTLSFKEACGEPQSPSSGSFNLTTNGTVTSALFSCVPGYEVFGHAVRECQSDGQWDLNEPICGKYL